MPNLAVDEIVARSLRGLALRPMDGNDDGLFKVELGL